jgi:hypothetical protein
MAVRLSALLAGRPSLPGTFLVLISVRRLSWSQGYSAAGRVRSIEISIDLIGNRTRYLPTCSIVPQTITLPRAPVRNILQITNSTQYSCSHNGSLVETEKLYNFCNQKPLLWNWVFRLVLCDCLALMLHYSCRSGVLNQLRGQPLAACLSCDNDEDLITVISSEENAICRRASLSSRPFPIRLFDLR